MTELRVMRLGHRIMAAMPPFPDTLMLWSLRVVLDAQADREGFFSPSDEAIARSVAKLVREGKITKPRKHLLRLPGPKPDRTVLAFEGEEHELKEAR